MSKTEAIKTEVVRVLHLHYTTEEEFKATCSDEVVDQITEYLEASGYEAKDVDDDHLYGLVGTLADFVNFTRDNK